LIALTGVLLLLLSGSADALGLHRCAHHDALPVTSSEAAGHQHGHGGHDSEPTESDSGCSCVGACALTGAALMAAPGAPVVGVARHVYVVSLRAPALALPATTPFILPYSTAPPAAL
jgi:hypothetical protein